MSSPELCLSLRFRAHPDPGLALGQALELLQLLGLAQPTLQPDWSRRQHPSRGIVERLSRTRRLSYWLEGEGAKLRFGPGGGADFYLDITFSKPPSVPVIDAWMPRLSSMSEAAFAYLLDSEWERWENETFPRHYELANKSTQGRKLYQDEVFDEPRIDVSGHAGRRVARGDYTEMLGHQMWLLPAFWTTTFAQRSQVTSSVPYRELEAGVLALSLSATPFSEKNQPTERVRRLLFP